METPQINIKNLRNKEQQQETNPILMSKEEYFEKLDLTEKNIAMGKGKTFTHPDEMNAWLNALRFMEDGHYDDK